MRRFWTLGVALATAGSLAIAGLALHASPTPRGTAPSGRSLGPAIVAQNPAPAAVAVPLRGVGSCAAAACHGSATPVPPNVSMALRNEHTTFLTADPHAGAYDVLLGARSQSIARNLAGKTGTLIEAHQDARCLACHSPPSAALATGESAETIRQDGVGCESCHGPAGGWIGPHTAVDWPARVANGSAAALGFVSLRDPTERARSCAGCHVGAPADPARGLPLRDVNHDLIAAGHPRLNWEYSAYMANYPKHWRIDPNERDRDARLWRIGQVATLRASLELLSDRARRADEKRAPWPELSEYGCYSCHFSLKEKPFRQHPDEDVPLGVPAWGSWNVPMLRALTRYYPGAPVLEPKLGDLRKLMSEMAADPKAVVDQSSGLIRTLDDWIETARNTRLDGAEVKALLDALDHRDEGGRRTVLTGWDAAAQLYLALSALYASQGQLAPGFDADGKLRAELIRLRDGLKFPDRLDSPAGFDPSAGK